MDLKQVRRLEVKSSVLLLKVRRQCVGAEFLKIELVSGTFIVRLKLTHSLKRLEGSSRQL